MGVTFMSCVYLVISFFFFFFQAEDGIRDGTVTGVQTCALPICSKTLSSDLAPAAGAGYGLILDYPEAVIERLNEEHGVVDLARCVRRPEIGERSEERRVGKECRSRWSAYH